MILSTDRIQCRFPFKFAFFYYFCKTFASVIRKFFPLDKNYLLEEAQLSLQDYLLFGLIEKSKIIYQQKNNPLQLEDAFSLRITNFQPNNFEPLHNFYHTLAGIYRFKHGDNQLAFLWDGQNHFEKYQTDWKETFEQWASEFCQRDQFVQAILDLSVFLPENRSAPLAENRMNFVMLQYFDLKIHKSRGIVAMKVA